MGRVIIKYKNNKLESFKCKTEQRASEIAGKRNGVIEWNFYEQGQRIPSPKKKITTQQMPASFEELEAMMKLNRLI